MRTLCPDVSDSTQNDAYGMAEERKHECENGQVIDYGDVMELTTSSFETGQLAVETVRKVKGTMYSVCSFLNVDFSRIMYEHEFPQE